MAERVGFEPTVVDNPLTSKAAGRARSESTTRSIVFRLGTLTPQMRGPSIGMPIGARTHADSQLLANLSAKGVRFVLFVRHSYQAATSAL